MPPTETIDERVDPTVKARAAARAKRFEDRIRKLIAGSPPLSQEQRDKLALLLRGDAA